MAKYTTTDIRNIALVGHSGAGKTSLAETLLHLAGATNEKGSIDRGTTVCDFDPQEKALKHTISPSLCHFQHLGRQINLIDTPGYVDLLGRTISVLPAVEMVAVVVDGQAGIELGTRRIMEAAARRNLCRMIVINKIDLGDKHMDQLLTDIQDVFGKECLPLNLPANGGSAVRDAFFKDSGKDTDLSSVEAAHQEMIDQVVEVDEALMERYLEEGKEPESEELHDAFEKALREGHLIPLVFASAETGVGVKKLLQVFAELAPNPREGNPPPYVKGETGDAEPVEVAPDPEAHAIAHVFKVTVDPYMGRVGVFRIHQGTIRTGSQLFVGDHRKPIKIAHLYKIQGKDLEEIPAGVPGDICAISKVDEVFFDAVLHDSHDEDNYHMGSLELGQPMLGLAMHPTRRGDEQKLSDALHKVMAEDPSVRIAHDPVANETVLYGNGELHLRILLEKMKQTYNVEVSTRPPSVPYRETITQPAEGHHRHKKQTGGAGQFGEVFLRVEPAPRGEGFSFINKVVGGAIPSQFIPAVEKGVRQVLETGAIAGYPLQDVRVTVYDGKHHSVDSKEVAFVAAGRKAFIDAIQKARPIVLEPIVNLHISAPSDNIGTITGDLSGMRGRILDQRMLPGNQAMVDGQAPLAETINYYSTLKAHTSGEGVYTLEFSHYEAVPSNIQQELVSKYERADED
jgi:elongation factor G